MKTPKPEPGYAIYLGRNGYPHDTEQANKLLTVGQAYKVTKARVGQSYTDYHLEGFEVGFNSVMFDADPSTLPSTDFYSSYHGL